jgi:hypothetical protein
LVRSLTLQLAQHRRSGRPSSPLFAVRRSARSCLQAASDGAPAARYPPHWRRCLLCLGAGASARAAMTRSSALAIAVLENARGSRAWAQQVAPDLLGQAGPLGRHRPAAADGRDIEAATGAALALGRLDVGQGAVAVGGRVIALEGLEGTDAMLARVGRPAPAGRLRVFGGGVWSKCANRDQDRAPICRRLALKR